MNIDSILFIGGLLPAALLTHRFVPGIRAKNWVLLIVSLVFYSFGSFQGFFLLLLFGAVNYLLGMVSQKKWIVAVGIIANLSFLCFYKYLNFLLGAVLGLPQLTLTLTVPIGISFFTLRAISYLVDAHRDTSRKAHTFPEFLLYLSFFPQILSGPIVRFSDFAPQLQNRETDLSATATGVRRFVLGLSKKLLLALPLGKLVDGIYALDASALDIRLAWLAAIGYSLQIYLDFSGYSDMAIGLGRMFGFHTAENFNFPYLAKNLGDFWHRWHISLSSWLRDYLYIPLGGNRRGKLRTGLNKLIVFTLCGIWHGASWTFFAWGIWHGVLSALESFEIIPAKKFRNSHVVGSVYTLFVVCIGFVLFRAESITQGLQLLGAMFSAFSHTAASTVALHSLLTAETVLAMGFGLAACLPVSVSLQQLEARCSWLRPVSYAVALVLFVLCLSACAAGGFTPFIYAQF